MRPCDTSALIVPPHELNMGKHDGRQSKLHFDKGKNTCGEVAPISQNAQAAAPPEIPDDNVNMAALLLATQQSITSVEAKMDNICVRIDAIMHKLQKHDSWLMEAEQRLSPVEDTVST
ncbi:hypothetical protein NDU88_009185 [Pleurodeles waltl]|uniref:Uncharacterized protein n=1 Tax=Pleurodeles waltl TaxID=8319 RepID=A0AAV7QQT8_PLEWA|nr:hypothetical protein NDU88_009185 [Pleurodeles waltl]